MLEFVLGCIAILFVFGMVWGAFLFLTSLFFAETGGSRDPEDG
jgi:hypothetical protein